MIFIKSRKYTEYECKLHKFCNKKFTNVIGGASKLLKYFIYKYNSKKILYYANIKYSTGTLYKKLNFTFLHIYKSKLDYKYSKSEIVFHFMNF